ncbi:MAG: hypothetical protein JWP92_3013 [Caulobacter sp.]|nr:hypothetical protein [Caulobacter sp.]
MTLPQDTEGHASLSAVLAALSAEMSLAAVSCCELDDALGQILQATPVEERMKVMQQLHTVDLLAQHVTAITDFTARLAQAAKQGVSLDFEQALSTITLGAVADRLKAAIVEADAQRAAA